MSTVIHHRWKILLALLVVVVFALAIVACGDDGTAAAEESPAGDGAYKADQLILATTTSLKDSGLLDELVLPAFNEAHPDITVKTIAVGSGEAMQMGRDGEADVLLVHSPTDEAAFMEDSAGVFRGIDACLNAEVGTRNAEEKPNRARHDRVLRRSVSAVAPPLRRRRKKSRLGK